MENKHVLNTILKRSPKNIINGMDFNNNLDIYNNISETFIHDINIKSYKIFKKSKYIGDPIETISKIEEYIKNNDIYITSLIENFININKLNDIDFDTIVIEESLNPLNYMFLHKIKNHIRFDNKIEILGFNNTTHNLLLENIDNQSMLNDSIDIKKALDEIYNSFDNMDIYNNSKFTYRSINEQYWKYINDCGDELSSFSLHKIYKHLNNKNVLVLSDSTKYNNPTIVNLFVKNLIDTFKVNSLIDISIF